jgi:hypothetical protein
MKLYRNMSEIRRKESLGRRLSLTGLLILFIGLLASFVPNWLPPDQPVNNPISQFLQANWSWISFAALPAGFVSASFGSYFINRYARRRWPGSKRVARPDEMLESNMKGFDDRHAYFAWSLPASHVLVSPAGVMVFALRSDRGRVTVKGDRWREPFSMGRIFTVFAREGVGNPAVELEDQVKKIQGILAANPSTANVPVEPVAVFLNPAMDIALENPTMPVLRGDEVKEYVRKRAKEVKLTNSAVREVTDLLLPHSKHIEEVAA